MRCETQISVLSHRERSTRSQTCFTTALQMITVVISLGYQDCPILRAPVRRYATPVPVGSTSSQTCFTTALQVITGVILWISRLFNMASATFSKFLFASFLAFYLGFRDKCANVTYCFAEVNCKPFDIFRSPVDMFG